MSILTGKTIITVAPTGAWPSKKDNPAIPLTPEEIADDVYDCWQGGAAVAHLHMRDDQGLGTMDAKKFEKTVGLIRERCDIVLNLTTSGELNAKDDKRMEHLKLLKPELASYDAGSMNWAHSTLFLNPPDFLEKLGKTMIDLGVKPEIEIFDPGMMYNSFYYIKKGVIKEPAHYQFVLGAPGGIGATVENLVFLKGLLPENSTWSAFGIGKSAIPIMLTTIALNGHVRVGMEDNVYYSKGVLAESNRQFVEKAARLIKEADKEPATPAEAKQIFGLS
jgi:3-keto-5-aminohexanoate cleavage enzyme